MTLAEIKVEWGRVFGDTSLVRFTEELFYEGFNQSMEYICLTASRESLRSIEKVATGAVDAGTSEVSFPAALANHIRLVGLTLAGYPCIEVPFSWLALVLRNPSYTSTNTQARYVREADKVKFLHTITTIGTLLSWYYIDKPTDVSDSQTTIDIPTKMHRPALMMTVAYGRWKDEQIGHEIMLGLWEAEMKKIANAK